MHSRLPVRTLLIVALLSAGPVARAEGVAAWRIGVVTAAALALRCNLFDAESAGVEAGYGDEVTLQRVYFRWQTERALLGKVGDVRVDLAWQGAYSRWDCIECDGGSVSNVLSAAPVFRIIFPSRWSPDVEASIGLAVSSATEIADRQLGTHFQFEDVLGLRWRFGDDERWGVSLQHIHFSNNGIDGDNDGITFYSAGVSYRY